MDGKKLEELRELVEFLKANGIAEFDMEQDDLKVRIKFAGEPAAAGGLDLSSVEQADGLGTCGGSCVERGLNCGSESGSRAGVGARGKAT